MKLPQILKLVFFVLLCEAAGALGSFFTISAIPNWYVTLNKPGFTPPNWVFGPAWFTLYALMGIALYLVFSKGLGKKDVQHSIYLFGLQLIVNVFWSAVFFGAHSLLGGLVVIVLLWVLILATILRFFRISPAAGVLLIPYLAWVSFASFLNFSIVKLN